MNMKFLYLPALVFCFSNASIAMDCEEKNNNYSTHPLQNILEIDEEYKDYQQVIVNWDLKNEFSPDAYILLNTSNKAYKGLIDRSLQLNSTFFGKEIFKENSNKLLLVSRTTVRKSELYPGSYSYSDFYHPTMGYVIRRMLDSYETTWTKLGEFSEL